MHPKASLSYGIFPVTERQLCTHDGRTVHKPQVRTATCAKGSRHKDRGRALICIDPIGPEPQSASIKQAQTLDIIDPCTHIEPLTGHAATALVDLEEVFGKHPILDVPVVEGDGQFVDIVSREALSQAFLERSESESLKLQAVVEVELWLMPTWELSTV